MTKRSRRNHSAAFKAKVALAGDQGRRDPGAVVHSVRYSSGNQIVQWKNQLLRTSGGCVNGSGQAAEAGPDIKTLHAKIGQLALENDF